MQILMKTWTIVIVFKMFAITSSLLEKNTTAFNNNSYMQRQYHLNLYFSSVSVESTIRLLPYLILMHVHIK